MAGRQNAPAPSLQLGRHGVAITVLASVAILVASINIFGGFAVTRRMLSMFTTDPQGSTTQGGQR